MEFCVIVICHGNFQNLFWFERQFKVAYIEKKFQYWWLILCMFSISPFQQNGLNFLSINPAFRLAVGEVLWYFNMPMVMDINKIQQDATLCRYLFTTISLYIFQVSIVPIIRST